MTAIFQALALCAVLVAGSVAAQSVPLPSSVGSVTKRPLPRFVSLKTKANARRGPGLDHRVDWIFLHRRMPLQVVAEYENWRRVLDADGTGGWVHYTMLRGERTVTIRSLETTLRDLPGEAAVPRAVAKQGVIAELGACVPLWCEVDANGVTGWVPRTDIWGVEAGEIRD